MSKLSEPRGRSTRIGPVTIRSLRSKCVVEGCDRDAVLWFPLLPGGPAFCGEHHCRATEYGFDPGDPADLTPWDT